MSDLETRMQKTIESTKNALATLRTGRANPDLLSKIMVNYYGSQVPLKQLASVSVPEPMLLQLNIFDAGAVAEVEKAIQTSDLHLTPNTEGAVIRLRIPELTEDRRKELVKILNKYVEEGKVALRNVRRAFMDELKEKEKNKEISEDEMKREQENTQSITDRFAKDIEEIAKQKESEIMTI